MFSIDPDIENELQKKYPDIHIKTIVNSVFDAILSKAIRDGATTITNIGKFLCFVAHSGRLGHDVVRLKFRPSVKLARRLREDTFLLENLPKNEFKKAFLPKTISPENIEIRQSNNDSIRHIKVEARKRTKDNLTIDMIDSIMDDNS